MEKQASVSKNMIMSIILTMSNFAFPLITYSYVARILGAGGTGKVAFVNSILQYFSYVAILGIPIYGVRECAKVRDDKEKLSRLVQELLIISMCATFAAYVGLLGAVFFITKLAEYKSLFAVMGIYILFNSIGVEWIYQACEEYTYITKRSILFKCISVILTFILIKNHDNILAYGFLTIFTTSASSLCNFFNIHKIISFKSQKHYNLKQHLKPILILFSASIVITIYANFDISMLGFIGSEEEVGIYNAALKVKNALLALSTAVTAVLIPRISYFIKKGDLDKVKNLIIDSARISLIISVPVSLYVFIFSSDVIEFLCGREYLPAINTLRILIICIMPLILTNLFGCQILIPFGKEKQYTQSVFVGFWINIVLNLLLIPAMGASGAAIGTLVTEIWNVFWMSKGALEYRKILLQEIAYKKYIVPIMVAAITVLFEYNFVRNLHIVVRLGSTAITFLGIVYLFHYVYKEPIIIKICRKLKIIILG